MKFLLAGGGTGGPTTTLIAIAEALREKYPKAEFLFVSDDSEPTKKLVTEAGMRLEILSTGKLRRYLSLKNFSDITKTFQAIRSAKDIIQTYKPDLIISAGSFVATPIIIAARKKIPILIHQQDIRPGLSNKIAAPFATHITVALKKSLKYFPNEKTTWTGNPARLDVQKGTKERAQKSFKLKKNKPIIMVIGGGTGATGLNDAIVRSAPDLLKFFQIIHMTGMGKGTNFSHPDYHQKEFITAGLKDVYAAADVVISRAGLATSTELAALKKLTIMIPLPNTHQEDNANLFEENDCVISMEQDDLEPSDLMYEIKKLMGNKEKAYNMRENFFHMLNPVQARKNIVKIVGNIIQ